MKVVIGGVRGSGKSTVGALVADRLGAEFLDADAFHPPENIRKMQSGIPLEDTDRAGWIQALGYELSQRPRVVLACSALKKAYRDALREQEPAARFVLLTVNRTGLEQRLASREQNGSHFMPASLLDSQLSTLETDDDFPGFENIGPPEKVADQIVTTLRS